MTAGVSAESWLWEQANGATIGPKARKVIELLAAAPRFTSYASAGDVAQRAGTDASTVVRTARALGFSGWPDLRRELRSRYLSSLSATDLLAEHDTPSSDAIVRAVRSDAEALAATARSLDVESCRAVADVVARAGRTLAMGSGSFIGPVAQLAHVGARLGLTIEAADLGGRTPVSSLALLETGDCVLIVNFWRLPVEVLACARAAGEAGATVCVITDSRESRLAHLADHVITVPAEGTSHFPSLAPATAVVHALLAEITHRLGERGRATIQRNDQMFARLEQLRREGGG
ncbi:MurR/RpiR family transcriptional regulator [Streptomyces sp. NPDC050433]|uniref:MurR/RpiR family transcriptional regulator n=1 Tax=unclassified Streptomyces TaxID=2593676 RepID=UPI003430084B